ncbi:tetratricopeptide repeat protein [Chitinibacter tainanensis]|uniref:tetratricopeptide repeat protein n=1 Tax=Chitinibacter tainanensis TaxID=230667 RepID=UPI002352AAE7|nr:tetratricopeptide repeat protein [Chitinibacter tainanensis]
MTFPLRAVLVSLSLWLGGCASTLPPAATPSPTPAAADNDADALPQYSEAQLPKLEMSDELMLRFLVGDIAAQRGQFGLAAEAWVDLARKSKDPRVAQRAAQLAVASGQLVLAQEATEIWIAAAPEALAARQLMVSLLLRSGRLIEAKPHLQAMFAAKPSEVAPFFLQMHQLWPKEVDRQAVLDLTLELTARYDNLPEAHFARAVGYGGAKQIDPALAELNLALKQRPDWEPAVLYKVQLLEGKDPQASAQLLAQAAKNNPQSLGVVLAQARLAADSGELVPALSAYEQVLAKNPDQLEALIGHGLVAMQLNEVAKAQRSLLRAVTLNPAATSQLAPYLGQVAEQQHQYQDAVDWYLKAGTDKQALLQPRLPRLYAKLGQQAKADQALAALPVATAKEQASKAQIEAQVWRERRQLNKALAALDKAVAAQPDEAELFYDRSLYRDLAGDYAGAEADLREFLRQQPNSVNGLNALGYILANRTDRLVEADTYLGQAIAMQPDNPVILDSLGWLRFKQGKVAEAQQLLERAYRQMPDAEVAAHLAEVLAQQGDIARAKALLDEALARQPDDEVALETRRRLGL